MKKVKKLISVLVCMAMLCAALLPTAFAADTVTRAEWISQLVAAFSMTVKDDTAMLKSVSIPLTYGLQFKIATDSYAGIGNMTVQ